MYIFKRVLLISLVFFFYGLEAKVPNYKEAEKILKKTWDETFPLPYSKVLKRDTTGKGILVYRADLGTAYIYTFVIFLPRYTEVEKKPVALDEGREIFLKLIFLPGNKEKQYTIEFSRFDEPYNGRAIRWIH